MSQESEKWSCRRCTYENWPKSQKCTICLTPRHPHLISEDTSIQERDIYKIAPLITASSAEVTASTNSSNSLNTQSNPYNKWSCSTCTYLNWPRAARCTQCLASPPSSTPSTPCNTTRSTPDPPRRNVHPPPDTGQQQQQDDPCSSPTDTYHNDKNKSSWSRALKWSCPACTYENWPKSQKCVLCQTLRYKADSPNSETEDVSRRRNYSDFNQRLSPPGIHPSNCSNVAAGGRRNNRCQDPTDIQLLSGSAESSGRLRHHRRKPREADWAWLKACIGVLEGDSEPVIQYLSNGGEAARQLTAGEVAILGRPSSYEVGNTLVHLAIKYQRDDILAFLLSNPDVSHPNAKRVPSDVSRDVAAEIRSHIATTLKQRKGDFPCYFVTEFVTFALPAEIEDFSPAVQERLFDELLDRDVQKELEEESPIINWSLELTERLGSRLYALWNRSAGDCLLDSALQGTWGVFDRDNTLRRALGESLCEATPVLYPRWKEAESFQANLLNFSLDEAQWQEDWATLLSLATQPGSALEQMHIFTLAHIIRRPIIVYGVKYVKSFRGEAIGYARFEGIYIPLLWEPSFCWKSPIALGYTRGHFSALVPMEPDSGDVLGAGANTRSSDDLHVAFLPLMTSDRQLLPIHFLTQSELGREEEIMRQWLDCCVTEGGILVAQQKIPKRSLPVSQMVEEWIDFYRSLPPHACHHPSAVAALDPDTHSQAYSSDADSDQE